jgi:hypothetical protein
LAPFIDRIVVRPFFFNEVVFMTRASQQRGITLIGLIFWGAIIAFLVVIGMQAVPAVQESYAVQRAVDQAAKAGPTVGDIRSSFDKTASVDYISRVSGKDLDITKVNGQVVVSYAYDKEIHLFGPAYLVLKFAGHSH